MQSVIRKTNRKGTRGSQSLNRVRSVEQKLTLFEMFERFMNYKQTEGLAKPTIQQYYEHFHYLTDYFGGDLTNEVITLELFRDYIGFMLNDRGLAPMTVNVRIRTMRAFLRHCYQEGWIQEAIHERFKPVKTPEDEIQSFTPAEVKALLNQIEDKRFVGFRDKVMIYTLLDTMVRISELLKIKRSNVDLNSGYIKLEPHEQKRNVQETSQFP